MYIYIHIYIYIFIYIYINTDRNLVVPPTRSTPNIYNTSDSLDVAVPKVRYFSASIYINIYISI